MELFHHSRGEQSGLQVQSFLEQLSRETSVCVCVCVCDHMSETSVCVCV